jgi:hypothetical protein
MGPAGATGPAGAAGATGIAGAPGATWYTGSGAPTGSTGTNGDYYLHTLTGDIYNKVSGSWGLTGNIKGAAGATGPAGAAGVAGANGVSITWLGSLSSSPSSPTLNNGYYDTTLHKSYIWNGAAWAVIAQDGATGTVGVPNGGTGITSYNLGDTLYGNASGGLSVLAGNTTAARQFLALAGTGSASAAPAWAAISAADVPDISGTYSLRAGNLALTTVGTVTTGTWNAAYQPRVEVSVSYTTSHVINCAGYDVSKITAQAGPLLFKTPSGTPFDMQILLIAIKDAGSPVTLAWSVAFAGGSTLTLPSATVAGKWLFMEFQWEAGGALWHLQGINQE